MPGAIVKILFLAANPSNSTRLALGRELREIRDRLRSSDMRDRFAIAEETAVRRQDLQRVLLQHEPVVVHFSGHGSRAGRLILETTDGQTQDVPPDALAELFRVLKDRIRCVVLNSCHSEMQAQAIARHIDCVIGMDDTIADGSAIAFAASFYQALAHGRNLSEAYELGRNEIDLLQAGSGAMIRLITRTGVNAADVVLSPRDNLVTEARQTAAEIPRPPTHDAASSISAAPAAGSAAAISVTGPATASVHNVQHNYHGPRALTVVASFIAVAVVVAAGLYWAGMFSRDKPPAARMPRIAVRTTDDWPQNANGTSAVNLRNQRHHELHIRNDSGIDIQQISLRLQLPEAIVDWWPQVETPKGLGVSFERWEHPSPRETVTGDARTSVVNGVTVLTTSGLGSASITLRPEDMIEGNGAVTCTFGELPFTGIWKLDIMRLPSRAEIQIDFSTSNGPEVSKYLGAFHSLLPIQSRDLTAYIEGTFNYGLGNTKELCIPIQFDELKRTMTALATAAGCEQWTRRPLAVGTAKRR